HEGGDAAAVPAMPMTGSVIARLALGVEFTWAPPVWVHVVLWSPLVVGSVMAVLPRIKGITVALQHRYRSTEEEGRLGGT
ncbi:MAG: DUF983 domain-containing protein, partial [Magnetovibrio sp.]|nr:DUF983 domain-containing protein [Magnetovibrio sp.]